MGCQGGEKSSGGRQGGSSSPSMKRASLQGFTNAQRLQVHRRGMNEGIVSHLTVNRKVYSSRSSPTGIVASGLTKRSCQTGGHSPSHVFETVHGRTTTSFANVRQKSKTSSPALWPSLIDKKPEKKCITRKPIQQTKPDLGIISEDKEEEEKEDTHVSPIKLAWVRRFAQNPSVRMRNKFRNRLSTIREECLSTISAEVSEDSCYKIREDVCISLAESFSKFDAVQDLCYSKATAEQCSSGRRSFKRSPSKEKRTIWGDTILAEEAESSDKENVESDNELECSKAAGRSVCLSGEYGLSDIRSHFDMPSRGTHSAIDRKYVNDGEKFSKKLGFLSHTKCAVRTKKISRHYSGDVSAKSETSSCRVIPIRRDTNVMRDSFEKQLELIKSLGIDASDDMANLEPDALSEISHPVERVISNINTTETDTCTNDTDELSSSEHCLQQTSQSLPVNNEAHDALWEFGLESNVSDSHRKLPCNVTHCETSLSNLTELSEDESEVIDTQTNNQHLSSCIQQYQVNQHDGLHDNDKGQTGTVNNMCELMITESADLPSQTNQQDLTDQAKEPAILGSSSVNIEATRTYQVIEVTENNNISEVVSATNYDCSLEESNLAEFEAAEANTETTNNGQKPISHMESVDGCSFSRAEDEKHEDIIYETPSDRLKTSDEHKTEINHPQRLSDLCVSITRKQSPESDKNNKDKGFDICIGAADDVCLPSTEGTHSLHTSTSIQSIISAGQTESINRESHHKCTCPCFHNNVQGLNPPTQPRNNFLYLQKKMAEKLINLQSTFVKGGKLVCIVQVARFDDSDRTVVWGIFSGKSWGNICSVQGREIVPELSRTNAVNERVHDIYVVEYDIEQGLNYVNVIVICENQGQQFCDDNYGRPYKINVCNLQQLP